MSNMINKLIMVALSLLGLGLIAFGFFSLSRPATTPVAVAPTVTPPDVAAPAPQPVVTPPVVNPLKETQASTHVTPAVPAAPSMTAVFPSAISPAHAGEKPLKARLKTCFDQYKSNKATNSNGGLKWVQKGGGYWSECKKHLEG
jgi:hypothetical protein